MRPVLPGDGRGGRGTARGHGGRPIDDEGDQQEYAAALAALGTSPARLRRILAYGQPRLAWEALGAGTHPEDPDGRVRGLVRAELLSDVARRCAGQGITVHLPGGAGYPDGLAEDAQAPAVLFARGDTGVLRGRARVALVGTRSASPVGLAVAAEIGASLSAAGVVVVSGLATGIDSAALQGALDDGGTPTVAVLGTAHDGRALAAQRRLAAAVAEHGAVLSEQAPGSPGARWHFAVRNRIMAALSHLVVVVECHAEGGALHTVAAARHRALPVAAVPGSVRHPAAAGTNALLTGGVACVRHGDDVLALLRRLPSIDGLPVPPARERGDGEPRRRPTGHRATGALPGAPGVVLRALGPDLADLEHVVAVAGLPLGAVALALEELADAGLAEAHGGWWRRVGAPGRRR